VTRRRVLVYLVPLGLVFLVLALAAARFLTVENVERQKIFALVSDEAAGRTDAVARRLASCSPACRSKLAATVARVRGPGRVKLALLVSKTSYSLGTAEGVTRVVWVRGPDGVPLVQCVRVRRTGNPLTGRSVRLLAVSAPLADNEDAC
jgi:hypothetical protein